jgi:hypothetical protein
VTGRSIRRAITLRGSKSHDCAICTKSEHRPESDHRESDRLKASRRDQEEQWGTAGCVVPPADAAEVECSEADPIQDRGRNDGRRHPPAWFARVGQHLAILAPSP